jgi:superfamily I DNA/RNA helicase
LSGGAACPARQTVFERLKDVAAALGALANDARRAFRNSNADATAQAGAERLLIVAGPGAGKSHLFLARIVHWLDKDAEATIYVATFVRKLVKDLEGDLNHKLTPEQRRRVQASTLHALARSLITRSGGTPDWRLGAYVRVIDRYWSEVVWDDVRAFHPDITGQEYGVAQFRSQLQTENYLTNEGWQRLRETHARLCCFYNAVGFESMIVLAREALERNRNLLKHTYWILDEYQDFNPAEDKLIAVLTQNASGVVLAGDDEQALYVRLKQSDPAIITSYYRGDIFASAMLPFCTRCSYYVCVAASSFIGTHRTENAIEKIYLPLEVNEEATRVQVIAAAAPETEIDYVRKFLQDHTADYEAYLTRREAGEDTDPFLLVLSQSGGLTSGKKLHQEAELHDLVAE